MCSICQEEVVDDHFTKNEACTLSTCLHIFHSVCIQTWLSRSDTCPTCRSKDVTCKEHVPIVGDQKDQGDKKVHSVEARCAHQTAERKDKLASQAAEKMLEDQVAAMEAAAMEVHHREDIYTTSIFESMVDLLGNVPIDRIFHPRRFRY
jgi:hypothetical protein